MNTLDRAGIKRIVEAAADRLTGDWLLVGGGAVALWLDPARVTEDIDLIGLGGASDERLRLLDLAAEIGIPVEALNSAADFFIRRIPGWRDQVELLCAGRGARIFRPTPTLFLLTKVGRLSEDDLGDCLAALAWARSTGAAVDAAAVRAAMAGLPASPDTELGARRQRLLSAL